MALTCKNCSTKFAVTENDKKFYTRIQVPEPEICIDCRAQRRAAYRNEKTLYARKCDFCEKNIISIYSANKKFPVYCQKCFWGDKWDPLDYGMDFNFSKPFFEQFKELIACVPRLAIVNKKSQNSEYCNYSFANKNCYLTFGNHYEEDCMYGRYSTKNKDCLDYLWLYKSELAYECLFSKNCYKSAYLDHCENCRDCYFSVDLKGCKNCLFCSNLRQKEYYILNKPVTKEEYFKRTEKGNLGSYKGLSETKKFFLTDFRKSFPFRVFYQINSENCEGNNLENCKNLRHCFDCTRCEDCSYGFQMDETCDSQDMTCMGYDKSEVCYQTIGCSGIFNCISCDSCWHDNDLMYCNLCFSSKNLFGCISLQRKQHCILNKKYSKNKYEETIKKIIEKMKETGEFGQFFPEEVSPFAYNETVASEFFPIEEKEVKSKGLKWMKKDKGQYQKQTYEVLDNIKDVEHDILEAVLVCGECEKNYKIMEKELKFYKNLSFPIPRLCPDCRLRERMKFMLPRKLFHHTCKKCSARILTPYAPGRIEQIYCKKCYEKEVY